MKNLRIALLSTIMVGLLPLTPLRATQKPATPMAQPASHQPELPQLESDNYEPSQAEIEAMYRGIFENAYIHIPQALKSKIMALNLMVSNGEIKLAKPHLNAFHVALESVSTAWQKYCNPTDPNEDITKIFELNEQIIAYLINLVKNDLNDLRPFVFKSKQPAPLNIGDMIGKFQAFERAFAQLELSMNELGKTKFQKFKQWLSRVNKRGNYYAKGFTLGAVTLAASILRYAMKPMPQHVMEEYRAFGRGAPAQAPAVGAQEGVWSHMASSDLGTAFANNPFVRWYDDNVIGTPPYPLPFTNSGTFDLNKPIIAGTGTGAFGILDRAKIPLLFMFTLPLAFKKFFDSITDGVNGWKACYKDPKEFFKWGELFNNEKQQVSAIEQLWIQGALEHSVPRITFDDIAGLHEQKQELIPVIQYLLNPEMFEKTGTAIEKGYLLYGPTRTGKTYLAEALAGELVHRYNKPLTFLKVNSSEMRLVGIKKVIEVIKKYAPCIVFIDELDLLNLQRDRSSDMLEQFLVGMTQEPGKQVIFLAATNRLDHIDQALLQPGRFGKIIPFENPTFNDRREFFEKELVRRRLNAKSINLERLAKETEDCSFGDLASILNHALSKSMQHRAGLSYECFENGIDTFKRKIVEGDLHIPQEERSIITAHLAGQALAYELLPTGEELHKVTMLPIHKKVTEERIWYSENTTGPKKIIGYGDIFTLHKMNTAGFDSVEQKINKIKVLLAGYVAEKLLIGATAYSYRPECNEQARQIAESIVFKGLKKEHFSRDAADAKLNEVQKLLQQSEAEVMQLLSKNKESLKKLADELVLQGTLMVADVRDILAPKPAMVVKETQAPTGKIKTTGPAKAA